LFREDKRGAAWHYRVDLQAAEPNHYPGPVPVDDVKRRLFGWEAVSSPVYVESPVTGGLVEAPGRQAIVRSDSGHLMGIFTHGYVPHPYVEWLLNIIATLLEDDLSIGSAGLLREGAVAWVSVEVPTTSRLPKGWSSGRTCSARPRSTGRWPPPSSGPSPTWSATTP
jgi:hypothetical protein